MKIGIPRERRDDERRAAASADTVKRYKGLGLEPVVEAGAGNGAAVSDQMFTEAGANVVDEAAAWDSEIVLKVQRPTDEEMARLKQGHVLIGMLDPYNSREQVEAYAKAGVTAFAMELLPRTTRAQAMDVLSSQANLAGYKALVDAMAEYSRVLPMMMTAAGTVTPAKMVAEHLKGQDIVVTTAQIPGWKVPGIITAEMVKSMKAGAVVLDMAA